MLHDFAGNDWSTQQLEGKPFAISLKWDDLCVISICSHFHLPIGNGESISQHNAHLPFHFDLILLYDEI